MMTQYQMPMLALSLLTVMTLVATSAASAPPAATRPTADDAALADKLALCNCIDTREYGWCVNSHTNTSYCLLGSPRGPWDETYDCTSWSYGGCDDENMPRWGWTGFLTWVITGSAALLVIMLCLVVYVCWYRDRQIEAQYAALGYRLEWVQVDPPSGAAQSTKQPAMLPMEIVYPQQQSSSSQK